MAPSVSKVIARAKNPINSLRQPAPTVTQGNWSQSFGKLPHFKSLSRSSTSLVTGGNTESTSGPAAASLADPLPATQPSTINVVLFGETGVGKSSVINLIARKEIAKVSSDVNGCTMQSTRYDISFDDMNFAIFDTIGLEEPQMGVNGYLKAIEKAYELIMKLNAAGGIHLLLFCMRGGRITATTQSNYRLFCECLCSTEVPIALVFTGLEREVNMEDWWGRNKTHIEQYGIKSNGHACITAVQDDASEEDPKYIESQRKIRELLESSALKNKAFSPEANSWFAKLGKELRSFIEKHRNPKRRDVMKVLTKRCKLDPDTARKIAVMMEKSDTVTKEEESKSGGDGQRNPGARTDGNREREVAGENRVKEDASSSQLGELEPEPHNIQKEQWHMGAAARTSLAKESAPPSQPRNDKPGRHIIDEGKEMNAGAGGNSALTSQPDNMKRNAHIVEGEGRESAVTRSNSVTTDSAFPSRPDSTKPDPRTRTVEEEREEIAVMERDFDRVPAPLSHPDSVSGPDSRIIKERDETAVTEWVFAGVSAPLSHPDSASRPDPRVFEERAEENPLLRRALARVSGPSNHTDSVKPGHRVEQRKEKSAITARSSVTKDSPPPDYPDGTRSDPHNTEKEGREENAIAKRELARASVPQNWSDDTKSERRIANQDWRNDSLSGKRKAGDHVPPVQPFTIKPERRIEKGGRMEGSVARRNTSRDRVPPTPPFNIKPDPRPEGGGTVGFHKRLGQGHHVGTARIDTKDHILSASSVQRGSEP